MVGLDLTNMDDLVLAYLSFLIAHEEPEHITFIHAVEDSGISDELSNLFPEVDTSQSLESIIREEIHKNVTKHLDISESKMNIILRNGDTTGSILSALSEFDPDLLVLGKKTGYEGEGILARKITKYAHCSLLFVAENSQYRLKNVHVPIRFNKASARAIAFSQKISERVDATIHIQHVYKYPKRFFPYIPSDQYSERMHEHLSSKYKKFKDKFGLDDLPECTFTVNKNGKQVDEIYDLTLRTRADIIVAGAKSKSSAAALLTEEMADNLAEYHFGVPVFIYKEKEEHIGLLKSLLEGE